MHEEINDEPETLAPGAGAAETGPASPYRVKLEVFEGPLDLLLHLIKRNEVEIVDIPIAVITDQYLAYLDAMRDLNLDIAGEFLVMAATLTLIKSRMLLPQTEGEGDEDEEADPRADLVRQLIEYQRFRETAQQLADRPLLNRDVFVRETAWDDVPTDGSTVPQIRASIWDLLEAFRAVLKRARPDRVHEVVTERVSLRDRVQFVLRALSVAKTVEFDSLFDEDATRLEIIVTFLAILELIRMQAIRAGQAEHFDRIVITLAVADISTVSLDLAEEYDGSRPASAEATAVSDAINDAEIVNDAETTDSGGEADGGDGGDD